MAEYIERETYRKRLADLEGWCQDLRKPGLKQALEMFDEIPAADVAPVVRGRWEFLGPNRLIKECMCGTCSVCKIRSKYIVNTMLCPNCGATMDGGDNDAVD